MVKVSNPVKLKKSKKRDEMSGLKTKMKDKCFKEAFEMFQIDVFNISFVSGVKKKTN